MFWSMGPAQVSADGQYQPRAKASDASSPELSPRTLGAEATVPLCPIRSPDLQTPREITAVPTVFSH